MKQIKLLKSLNNISDEYISEADKTMKSKKQGKRINIGWLSSVAAALVIGLCLGNLPHISMGSASKNESMAVNGGWSTDSYYDKEGMSAIPGIREDMKSDEPSANDSLGISVDLMNNANGSDPLNLKLVYTAYVNLQTTEFEQSVEDIKALVSAAGGYFESSVENNSGLLYDGDYRSADYTIRIPSGTYKSFVNALGEKCHVTRLSESVDDIGMQYSDAEGRLNTLKIKQERLQALMAKADNMSDIIQLENELSSIEYEIDYYSGRLRNYDSLVNYSTVHVSLEKVVRVSETIGEKKGFLTLLGEYFTDGLDNFAYGLENISYMIAYNFIGIVILVILAVFGLKFYKKHRNQTRLKAPRESGNTEAEE